MGPVSGDVNPHSSTQLIDVSRTVQSSDLFTPYREPRVTLPTIGSFRQRALPFGGKYWGGPLTEYGGIGGLAFIGRQQVRDLEVTRSHRHYRSGFSKYLTDVQSHRLTRLYLSECRLNDQILPALLHADISKLNWQRTDPWPDSQAYGTHRSIFEVFPTVKRDPSPSDQDPLHNTRGSVAQPLRKTTQSALLYLNQKLYDRTLYQDSYPNYLRQQPGPPVLTLSEEEGINDGEEGTDEEANDEEEEDETDEKKEKALPTGETTEQLATSLRDDQEKQCSNSSPVTNKSVTSSDTPQIMEDTIRQFKVTPNRPMLGVGPCWPPGSSYVIDGIHGAQLVERSDIIQPTPVYHTATRPAGERKLQRLLSARARLAKPVDDIIPSDPTTIMTTTAPTLAPTRTAQDEFLKRRMHRHADDEQQSSNQDQEKETASANQILRISRPVDGGGQRDGFKLPIVQKILQVDRSPFVVPPGFPQASLVLPPAPLADCLSTDGTRIPHRLGLRYKTEAHKRYHLMYPDDIPDLRTNRKEGKKYFFYNFHSSVFRG